MEVLDELLAGLSDLQLNIFICNDKALLKCIINKLLKVDMVISQTKYVDTVQQVYDTVKKPSILAAKRFYVVSNDIDYLKNEKLQTAINEEILKDSNRLILVYSSIDKRSSFYKKYKDYIIDCTNVSCEELYDEFRLELSKDLADELFNFSCLGNFTAFSLEMDKISNYAEYKNISLDNSYEYLKNSNMLMSTKFDFPVECLFEDIITNNWKDVFEFELPCIKKDDISIFYILTVFYNKLRSIYLLQSCNSVQRRKYLSDWKVKKVNKYTSLILKEDVLHMLKTVIRVEQEIKQGKLNINDALDYLIINLY